MLKAIDIGESIRYICKGDEGDNPTVFYLGNISNRDKLRLLGINWQTGQIESSKMNENLIDLLKCGIKKIENLDGQNYDQVDEKTLEKLPLFILVELVSKLIELNFATEAELKNSP